MQLDHGGFERPNLSEDIVRAVRGWIVDGKLAAGARINEVHLATALKVSRTPLREALARLVAEGAVQAVPRRGFFVTPMTVSELEQLYDVRPLLDPEALRLAGLPDARQLARLERVNRLLAEAATPEAVIATDDVWHLTLLAHCPNRVLVGMIEQLMLRSRRYEVALMRERPNVDRALDHHTAIIETLRKGDLEGACAALKDNMTHGREPILAWLREKTGAPGGVA